MNKVIELIIVTTLLVFSFVAGVKYSDSIRSHASWLFEAKEEEVELPDLSSESSGEVSSELAAPNSEENDANQDTENNSAPEELPASQ